MPRILAAAMGTLVAVAAAEVAYRIFFAVRDHRWVSHPEYRLMSAAYGQFDAQFGQQFIPGSHLELTLVRGGRAVWCAGTIASANEDGLGGRDTLASFQRAELRLLTTGDSLTHRQQKGLTIPDVIADEVADRTGLRTANLNFGRGGYGLLHMLSIAAAKTAALLPDVVIIEFISNDLARGRWWTRETVIDGRIRAQVSSAPDGFDDSKLTNDEYVVDPRATAEFCARVVAAGGDDPVIQEANRFFRDYRKWKQLDRDPLSLRDLYLAGFVHRRLTGVNPNAEVLLPLVDARRFAADIGFRESARALRDSSAVAVLVHLPVPEELAAGRPLLDRESSAIWTEVERGLGTRARTFWSVTNPPEPPAKIDQAPFDAHPNFDGLRFYGDYVARAILEDPRVRDAVTRARRRQASAQSVSSTATGR